MQTAVEILRTIEQVFGEYETQVVRHLLGERLPPLELDEVQIIRGKGVATKQLLAQLRNILGYDPANL